MGKYRKKPVVIEAIKFTGENFSKVRDFMKRDINIFRDTDNIVQFIYIPTLEGDMRANPGDYIIKGIKGEFYPCKPDIFEQTYEKVEE